MNEELFIELQNLKLNKSNLQRFIDELKKHKIAQLRINGEYFVLDSEALSCVIKYSEEAIEKLETEISKFKLTKIID